MAETYEKVERERDQLRREVAKHKSIDHFILTKLPALCAHRNNVDGKPTLIIRGELGYVPMEGIIADPDKFNHRIGVDAFQATAMEIGSMFGWGVPGADPDSYRKDNLRPITGSYTQLEKSSGPAPIKPPEYPEYDPQSPQTIADLIVTAFEGASNHWLEGADAITSTEGMEKPWYSDGKFYGDDFKIELREVDDTGDGAAKHLLTMAEVERGFHLLKKQCPNHWDDLLAENWDANTADAWLQLAVLGEITYG